MKNGGGRSSDGLLAGMVLDLIQNEDPARAEKEVLSALGSRALYETKDLAAAKNRLVGMLDKVFDAMGERLMRPPGTKLC